MQFDAHKITLGVLHPPFILLVGIPYARRGYNNSGSKCYIAPPASSRPAPTPPLSLVFAAPHPSVRDRSLHSLHSLHSSIAVCLRLRRLQVL